MRRPFFGRLRYESLERRYWLGDDDRWGNKRTLLAGFWFIAFCGRIRDWLCPGYKRRVRP